jgi:DMSO/TMAO reductase YedYZ molybdopterin-dependent catalytic subunit
MHMLLVMAAGAAVGLMLYALLMIVSPAQQQQQQQQGELSAKALREVRKKQHLADAAAAAASGDAAATQQQQHQQQPQQYHEAGTVPVGNFPTPRWLTTDLGQPLRPGYAPPPDPAWRLRLVRGARCVSVGLAELEALGEAEAPRVVAADWHCVTGWSKLGLTLRGVPLAAVLRLLLRQRGGKTDAEQEEGGERGGAGREEEEPEWDTLFQSCADGYTAPISRADLGAAFLALRDGETGALLSARHGGPRIVVPHLWGWKSAKWLESVELLPAYRPGFWERIMCHPRGRVYDETSGALLQERWAPCYGGRPGWATALANVWHHALGPGAYHAVLAYGGRAVGVLAGWRGLLRRGRRPHSPRAHGDGGADKKTN